MRAMILDAPRRPLRFAEVPLRFLRRGKCCCVCTPAASAARNLHIVDGELPDAKLPLILGHQIVGTVIARGEGAQRHAIGDRVGVPWLGWSCGQCRYCLAGEENLCDNARFTGYHIDGGYAEECVADERFAFPIPAGYPDLQAAPLLCAGLIGYRAYRLAGEAKNLGLYGFGAAGHLIIQLAVKQQRRVYALTSPGDIARQDYARSLGAVWAGGSDVTPPELLDAAIIFAPVGALIPAALRALAKGGVVVAAGIHMSDIPSFPYEILWEERVVRSVANLTRRDAEEFLTLAPHIPIHSDVTAYPLEAANQALDDLRAGRFTGAAVIVVDQEA